MRGTQGNIPVIKLKQEELNHVLGTRAPYMFTCGKIENKDIQLHAHIRTHTHTHRRSVWSQ